MHRRTDKEELPDSTAGSCDHDKAGLRMLEWTTDRGSPRGRTPRTPTCVVSEHLRDDASVTTVDCRVHGAINMIGNRHLVDAYALLGPGRLPRQPSERSTIQPAICQDALNVAGRRSVAASSAART